MASTIYPLVGNIFSGNCIWEFFKLNIANSNLITIATIIDGIFSISRIINICIFTSTTMKFIYPLTSYENIITITRNKFLPS
ncbi:hypothetical protein DQK91_20535 [Oceanidesulfovibrio marinus]|uniref:Uncharacterized protein n=1 Tax=Oceanidesulfovibrio marinus TaxID=370038 RepID=A0A6P1ZEB3_9BACT|nr:hypothetical protein DQK91_20535 [Oceanidesulfovibrio marinus]